MSEEQNKKVVADAIKEISKEQQEQEIKKIKDIVKTYLEKIQETKGKEDCIRKERVALEKDLDDLKAGRLDKIEERQGKDPVHDKVTIIEIHRIEKEYIPYQPWRSPWLVEWKPPYMAPIYYTTPSSPITNSFAVGSGTTSINTGTSQTTGALWQNFSGGTYTIKGQNIYL